MNSQHKRKRCYHYSALRLKTTVCVWENLSGQQTVTLGQCCVVLCLRLVVVWGEPVQATWSAVHLSTPSPPQHPQPHTAMGVSTEYGLGFCLPLSLGHQKWDHVIKPLSFCPQLCLTVCDRVYTYYTTHEENSSHEVDTMVLSLCTALKNIFPSVPLTLVSLLCSDKLRNVNDITSIHLSLCQAGTHWVACSTLHIYVTLQYIS